MERGVGELVGEQAEPGNVGRPADARGDEFAEGDLHRVSGFGALDEDGAGHRIDLGEVDGRHVSRRRFTGEVSRARVEAFEMNRVARPAPQHRREVAAPGEIVVLAVDGVVAGDAHELNVLAVLFPAFILDGPRAKLKRQEDRRLLPRTAMSMGSAAAPRANLRV
jgi:hypothetical protein